MKIIYYCYGGTHSSVLAAAIHVGQIAIDKIPNKKDINSLPLYDKVSNGEIGIPYFYGKDELNNSIYVLGLGSNRNLSKDFLLDYVQLFNISSEQMILVAALPYVSFVTKLGGILSRRLGLKKIGRPLVTRTLQKLYPKYSKLVLEVKNKLNNMEQN